MLETKAKQKAKEEEDEVIDYGKYLHDEPEEPELPKTPIDPCVSHTDRYSKE